MTFLLACTPVESIATAGDDPVAAAESASPDDAPGPGETDPTDAVFDPTVIHDFVLDLAPAEWADVRDNPYAETWHAATFRHGDDVVETVGIRAFGAGSLIPGKPSIKISFDHYVPGQEWLGLEQLKLDNSSQDPGFMNELVGTSILRRAGLPAARTGWARLTVNDEQAGFYVLFEPVDDQFLHRWFGDDSGNLYGTADGHHGQGLNRFANGGPLDWYVPQTASATDGSDLVAVTELVASGRDEELVAALDVDEFTRMSVTRSVFGGIDTFSADGNNFYLYNLGGYWSIVAWDLDADLGYPYYFSQALAVDPSAPWLTSPWAYNPVSGAAYTDPVLTRAIAMGVDIDALVDELLAGPGAWSVVDAQVVDAAALIRDDVYDDLLGYGPSFDQRRHDLRLWIHTRLSTLLGRDAAPCAAADAGVYRAADLAPTGTVGWGSLLVDATNWGPGFTIAGEHHCTGLFAHAPSDVVLTVPGGVTSFSAMVGLQDWTQRCGDGATFSVVQDDATLWTSPPIVNYDDAVATGTIGVSPGELRLVASPNAEYSCDTAAWVDVELR